MGAVYLVQHPRLQRLVALKVLAEGPSADPEFRARFLREAELASRVSHPNIVEVYDRGVEDGVLWITMQYVEGSDVTQLLRAGPNVLPPDRAVRIVGEAARGLDAAHAAGLLHRDVKPANILVSAVPGRADRVLVTDFGIARAAEESTVLTAAGEVLATLSYAAPEQIEAGRIDHRVDVYALGCTLFHMLTGSTPFPRPTAAAVMAAHLIDPPPRPSALNPALPPQLDEVVARAMAKKPDDRYRSCGELAAAAWAALCGTTESEPPRRRRRGLAIAAIGVVIALVAVAATVWALAPDRAAPQVVSAPAPTLDYSEGWGTYGYIVNAFPKLLPHMPISAGYQGIWCRAQAEDDSKISFDVTPVVGALECYGQDDPVFEVLVQCVPARMPISATRPTGNVILRGEERWKRSSGGGRILWSDWSDATGKSYGRLDIGFEDPKRSFCGVRVTSGTETGQSLHDRWWPSAPL
ncbi:serine/threonine protein kinase [Nocardia sp. CA2R105]|nr:serine/threonine protein kinase [Nocardia coffeae]